MKQLRGKVALVTGASKGLGVHIALALAKQGVHLVLAARTTDALRQTCRAAEAHGVRALAVPVDLSERASLEDLVTRAERAFGRIDILVNNAGVLFSDDYAAIDPEAIDQTIRVNLRAPMLLARRVLPGMIARGEGHIVNISSVAGMGGAAYHESYSATKHALLGFTRSLRLTLRAERHPVGASAVCPGFVPDTGMFHQSMRDSGAEMPALFGTASTDSVARAVIRAIRHDHAEVVVNSLPFRPIVLLQTLFPSVAGPIAALTGIRKTCRDMARGPGVRWLPSNAPPTDEAAE